MIQRSIPDMVVEKKTKTFLKGAITAQQRVVFKSAQKIQFVTSVRVLEPGGHPPWVFQKRVTPPSSASAS